MIMYKALQWVDVPRDMSPRAEWAPAISMILLAVMTLAKDPSLTASTFGAGLYCSPYPNCICANSIFGSYVHCEGMVDILHENKSMITEVNMECLNKGSDVNPYEFLSLITIDPEKEAGIKITFNACPPPKRGYQYLFNPQGEGEVKKWSPQGPWSIVEIKVYCVTLKEFSIQRRHLEGLRFLRKLHIDCPVLEDVPKDLLLDVKDTAEDLLIINSPISSLPKDILSGFKAMKTLDLRYNNIRVFPRELLKDLVRLTTLFLGGNMIESLDEDLFYPTKRIRSLQVSENLLSTLPKSLSALSNLQYLYASNNRIKFLGPEHFNGLRSLTQLQLKHNEIRMLDLMTFSGMERISSIHLVGNMIGNMGQADKEALYPFSKPRAYSNMSEGSTLPEDLFVHNLFLHDIHLQLNFLTTLPENIFAENMGLRKVNISSNRLIHLPSGLFSRNINLVYLDLSQNYLTELSETFLRGKRNLTFLSLSNNSLETLGEMFFSGLHKLEEVDLSNNLIKSLPRHIFSPENQSMAVKFLSLEGNLLTNLPGLRLPRLTDLNLARNLLQHLDSDVWKYAVNIQRLNLSYNHLRTLEDMRIYNTPHLNLSIMDFSHNLLEPSINFLDVAKYFENLKILNFSGNLLEKVEFSYLHTTKQTAYSKLEYLDLSNNSISNFSIADWNELPPRVLSQAFSLKYLDLSRNRITLNDSISLIHYTMKIWGHFSTLFRMEALEVLLLSHNEIEILPVDMTHFNPCLRYLDLSHNKIKYLWHQNLLFTNGISKHLIEEIGLPERYFIKAEGNETYYLHSNLHHLTIDLRYNEIKGIELSHHLMWKVPKDCQVDENFGRATMLLGHNPIVCGCQAHQILRYALREIRPVGERERTEGFRLILPFNINIENLTCWEPISVRGKALLEPDTWEHHLLPSIGLCELLTSNSSWVPKEIIDQQNVKKHPHEEHTASPIQEEGSSELN